MEKLIFPPISKQISMIAIVTSKFLVHLTTSFKGTYITNESYLSFMTEHTSWPPPKDLATYKDKADLVTVYVILLLFQLVPYTILFLNKLFYLSLGFMYQELTAWYDSWISADLARCKNQFIFFCKQWQKITTSVKFLCSRSPYFMWEPWMMIPTSRTNILFR